MHCAICGAAIGEDAANCAACGNEIIRVRATLAAANPLVFPSPRPSEAEPEPDAEPRTFTDRWPDQEPERGQEVASQPSKVLVGWAVRRRYAGFWLRALAFVIDTLLLSIIIAALLLAFRPHATEHFEDYAKLSLQQRLDPDNPAVREFTVGVFPIWLLGGWLYYALLESSPWQATVGKRLLGLCVTDLGGHRLTFIRAAARAAAMFTVALLPFGFLSYTLAGFTREKQALHDLVARCVVLRRTVEPPPARRDL